MGLLPDSFYQNLQQQQAQAPAAPPQPAAPENAPNQDAGPIVNAENALSAPLENAQDQQVQKNTDAADLPAAPTNPTDPAYQAETARLSRQGSSPFSSFFGRSLGEVFGFKFPDDRVWNSMSSGQKAGYTLAQAPITAAKIAIKLPRQIVTAPVRIGYSIYKPWADLVSGKQDTFQNNQDQQIKVPWLGNISTYWKSYDDARKSGVGPLAATVSTVTQATGDLAISSELAKSINTAFQPRSYVNGRPIIDTQPIKEAMVSDQGGARLAKQDPNSPNEYYSLPKSVAKNYGGNSNDTFLKVSPANVVGDAHSVEVSAVQLRGGAFKQAIDAGKNFISKFTGKGGANVYKGDFGPEVKLDSQIVPTQGKLPIGTRTLQAPETPELQGGAGTADKVIAKTASDINLQGGDTGALQADMKPPSFTDEQKGEVLNSILPKPLKGFEDSPVTSDQLAHLDEISQVNKIDPELARTIIRNVSGKDIAGEMTQSDYVKASQVLGAFNKGNIYTGTGEPFINPIAQNLSPTRRFFRNVEEKTNMPVYSKGYIPMEDAAQLARQFTDLNSNRLNDIFTKDPQTGKPFANDYTTPKFAEERRLVKSYTEGNSGAILDNPKLTTETKAELVKISDGLKTFYNDTGPALGIDPKYFLENYQPHIQNIGGIYQLYKDAAEIPDSLKFFAENKRNGALTTQIDDALALAQIYTRAGAKKLFFNPALDQVKSVLDTLPETLKGTLKNYVQDKLGYAGRTEQFLNEIVPKINQTLGMNLPPDLARKATQAVMDTTYSAALGLRPDAVVRELLQSPLVVFPRLGSRFFTEGVLKSLSKEGQAELSAKGFTVPLGVPYGEELAQESSLTGKVGTYYRNISQGTLQPYHIADSFTRGVAYFQGKAIWDDALGKLADGKSDWAGVEKNLDLNAFSPVDRNIIRQRLIDGDSEGAFNNYIRNIIDDTKFPYRKGSAGQIFSGLGGKMIGQFTQWPIEYAHTISSWLRTGQFDKLIRFYASATTVKRTLQDAFGLDPEKWIGLNPLNLSVPPFAKMAVELGQIINAHLANSAQDINTYQDQLINEVKNLGYPGAVQSARVQNFWKSINLSNKDNLPKGQYGIYDKSGKLTDTTDFANLFWGTLWGFPTQGKVDNQNLQQDLKNASFDYTDAKNNVLELYRQEKYQQANQLIQQYGIKLSPADFDKYYIPLNQRTFKALPPMLQAQFAPRVYNTNAIPNQ